MAYTYVLNDTNNSNGGSSYVEPGLNLGVGTKFIILGAAIGGNEGVTGVDINGTGLTPISGLSAAGACSIWAGTPTLTGSDTVTVTGSAIGFVDFTLFVWTATGLSSTIPVDSGVSSGVSSLQTSGGHVQAGDYVFAITGAIGGGGHTLDFGSSNQAPDSPPTNPNRVVGPFNTPSCSANWTASSGGIVGGNFVAAITESTSTYTNIDGAIAVWRPSGAAAVAVEAVLQKTIFVPTGRSRGPSRGLSSPKAYGTRSSIVAVTINANNSGTVSFLKAAAKTLPVSSSGTVSYLKATGKLIAVASSGAVSYLKSIAKTLAVASTSSTLVSAISSAIGVQVGIAQGFLFKPGRGPMWDTKRRAAFPASAAGNQFLVAVTANSSSAVSYVKSSGKNVAVTSSGAVSYLKAVAKRIAVTSSGAVSYLKAATKTLTVISSGAVSTVKSTTKTILATCSGAVTAAGIKVRIVIISVTSSGAVSVRRSVGKTVSVVSSGATSFTKSIAKVVAVAATGSVSFAKSITKPLTVVASGLVSIIATFRASGAGAVYHVTVSVVSTTLTQWLARFIKAKGPESTPRASGWPAAPR